MSREDGIWLQDWTTGDNLKINPDGSLNVQIGCGDLNSFAVSADRTGIGTTELPVMLFRNPTGSTKTIRIKEICCANSHNVSSFVRFRTYVSPTVTSTGTALTEVSLRVGSGNTPSGEAFSSPTVSANGTEIDDTMTSGNTVGRSDRHYFNTPFTLAANTAILVTAVADGAGRTAHVAIYWEEV